MEGERGAQETKFCSNCQRDIPAINFMMHEPHCRRHVELCKYCKEPVPKSQMEEHIEENHVQIPCEKCRVLVAKDSMDDHLADVCPHRSVHCDFCDLDIKMSDYNAHAYVCGSRTDICEVCHMRVMLREMANHGKNLCDRTSSLPPVAVIKNPALPHHPPRQIFPPPPPYAAVELDSEQSSDSSQWPHRPTTLDNQTVPYVAVDDGGSMSAEQENDPSAPSEMPGRADGARPPNPTMKIDATWLSSMKEVYGENADLDALLAQNMMIENLRQVTVHDDYPPPEDSSLQPQRPGVKTQQLRSDAALANALQYEFDKQDIFTAHDSSFAHQFQNEMFTEATAQPNPENTAHDEELARHLQEEENRQLREWSARQYDLHSEELRARREEEMKEAPGNESRNVTDDDLARQRLVEERPTFALPDSSKDSYDINLTSRNELHYGRNHHYDVNNYAESGSYSVQQADTHRAGSQGARPFTQESQQEKTEEIDDIPCDLCSEAVPFDCYNDHLQAVHRIDASIDDLGSHHLHRHHRRQGYPYHSESQARHVYPTSNEYHSQEREHLAPVGRQSPPRQHLPTYTLEESSVVSCAFCGRNVSKDNIRNHEMVCLQNPHSSRSFLQLEHSSSPSQTAWSGSAVDRKEDTVPCEFCNELCALADIQVHQAQCHQLPLRHLHQFGEDHGQLSPNDDDDDLGSHPFPHTSDSAQPVGQFSVPHTEVPCESCQKMLPFKDLHHHQALCMLSHHSPRTESDNLSGGRYEMEDPPMPTPRMSLLPKEEDPSLNTSILGSQQVLNNDRFPHLGTSNQYSPVKASVVGSARCHQPQAHSSIDGERLSHDGNPAPPAPTAGSCAAKSKRKVFLAPNFPSPARQSLQGGRDLSHTEQTFSPVSPSQDKSSSNWAQGEVKQSLVTGCDSSSESKIVSGHTSSKLVVMTSQLDNCHVTSDNSSESSHTESPIADAITSSSVRKKQQTKLIAHLPLITGGSTPSRSVSNSYLHGQSSATACKSSAGPSEGRVLDRSEDKYSTSSKTSSKTYGALRELHFKPVVEYSGQCGSEASSQAKRHGGVVPGTRMPGVQNRVSSQGKKTGSYGSSYTPHHYPSGSNARKPPHSETGTRKPPSFEARTTRSPSSDRPYAGGGARYPSQKAGGVKQSYQPGNDAYRNSRSKAGGSHSSGRRMKPNGFEPAHF